ncbi:hypothetical protein EST38_g8820 [Candolleomyces aberdarensis]|uniref:Uncharacterized protein n=1 Tax=Candolleomyces aberdarensis TaxID=2316362 RepID=A0A4Q2DBP0_9AGAR|nr:hypothetical protein EST38_g8820 [Candolleomyces aberdarensis]
MARSKWMPFTPQQAPSREPQKSAKPEDAIQPTSSAEIKKFGLENVCFLASALSEHRADLFLV